MDKYIKLTDFDLVQLLLKEVRKINVDKEYNINALSNEEKMLLIKNLKEKLDLDDVQVNYLIDNYPNIKNIAKKLYSIKNPNKDESFIDIYCIRNKMRLNLLPINFLLLFILTLNILFIFCLGIKEAFGLIILFSLMFLAIIAFIYIPISIELNRNLRIIKNNESIIILGKIIKISLLSNLIYSFKFSHSEKIYYLKIKLFVNGKVQTFISPLINNSIYCNYFKVKRTMKTINNDFRNKTYKFIVKGNIIETVKPNIISQIIKKISDF